MNKHVDGLNKDEDEKKSDKDNEEEETINDYPIIKRRAATDASDQELNMDDAEEPTNNYPIENVQ